MPTQTCLLMFPPNPSSCSSDQNPCYKTFAGSELGGFWRNSKFRKKRNQSPQIIRNQGYPCFSFHGGVIQAPEVRLRSWIICSSEKNMRGPLILTQQFLFRWKIIAVIKVNWAATKNRGKKIALNGIWAVQCRYPWSVKPKLRADHLISS